MRTLNTTPRLISVILMLGVLGGCGYAQWPANDDALRDVNRPPGYSSGNSFVGASAVVVGKGDSVFALSRRHRVPMRAIIESNNLTAPFVLHIGQRIILPRAKAHTIVRGDTLYAIANTYDVNAFELARMNGLKKPFIIHVGNRLILPSGVNAGPLVGKTTGSKTLAVSPKVVPTQKSAAPNKIKRKPPAWASPPKLKVAKATKPITRSVRKAISAPPKTSKKGFLWPVRGRIISNYGAKAKGLRNDGINIQAGRGTSVRAAENGVVAYAGNELRGFGNLLLIKHSGGWVTAYAHNDMLLVKRGQKIKRGQNIATIGSTGNVSSPQLHFEIRRGNKARDPKTLLRGKA